jgi:ribokinase
VGRVVVVGSLNVDSVVTVERHPKPGETVLGGDLQTLFGGKGANQAVAAARVGADVAMVGRVGDDAFGSRYIDRLRELGIDVAAVQIDRDRVTGHAAIAVAADGENTIIVSPGANAAVTTEDLALVDALGPGDVLLAQLELDLGVVSDAARRASEAGARVVLNLAPYADLPEDVLELADPVVVNEHEAELLEHAGLMTRSLLVTLGGEGARWDGVAVPAAPVDRVVDTTGAGDAFCGALAAALASGASREDALRAAATAGAEAVGWVGAQPR